MGLKVFRTLLGGVALSVLGFGPLIGQDGVPPPEAILRSALEVSESATLDVGVYRSDLLQSTFFFASRNLGSHMRPRLGVVIVTDRDTLLVRRVEDLGVVWRTVVPDSISRWRQRVRQGVEFDEVLDDVQDAFLELLYASGMFQRLEHVVDDPSLGMRLNLLVDANHGVSVTPPRRFVSNDKFRAELWTDGLEWLRRIQLEITPDSAVVSEVLYPTPIVREEGVGPRAVCLQTPFC